MSAGLKGTALTVCAVVVLAAAWTYGSRMKASTQVQQPAVRAQLPDKSPAIPADDIVKPAGDTGPSPVIQPPTTNSSSGTTATASPVVFPVAKGTDPDIVLLRARALTLPVQGINTNQLTDTYTQARAAGTPHEALDIMAARGTPVLAVEDGRLAKLFLSKSGGITMYQFDPTGEYAYYYAHLDRYADNIAEGANIKKGQLLGYVGSTGNALPDAPHLHFAIFKLGPERQWWRGTPLNPYEIWRHQN